MRRKYLLHWLPIVFIVSVVQSSYGQKKGAFHKDNLVAWCIVPFDAMKRSPEERAAMLKEIGITRLAYDWREEHIPTFDAEFRALSNQGIKLEAFWLTASRNAANNTHVKTVFDFLQRNQVKTQTWLLMFEWKGFDELSQAEKVAHMAEEIRYIAQKDDALGCQVAHYRRGGWVGDPEYRLEIIRQMGLYDVGIVYNLHHARSLDKRFKTFEPQIHPSFLGVNI